MNRLNLWVQQGLGKLLSNAKNPASLFPVGLLNGLLPCGLVYVAIAAALATMSSLNAMLLNLLVWCRLLMGAVQLTSHGRVQGVVYQRGFARTGYAGYTR